MSVIEAVGKDQIFNGYSFLKRAYTDFIIG
jgi:hypothetical protein